MNKHEAETFFEENFPTYNESGTFSIAIHGPLSMLKDAQKESVIPKYLNKISADSNQKTGTLLIDPAMEYAASIMEWVDFAAKYPELEIAVTGAVTYCNSGETSMFAWYSPAGSPELEGTEDSDPIGGLLSAQVFFPMEGSLPLPVFTRTCRFSTPLGSWQEEDHDSGWVAVWKNAQGELGNLDLLNRECLERYDAEDKSSIPPEVAAAADLVSKLDGLEDGPEGEQVVLQLWKTLFPEANVRIQREDGKCRYLDNAGGEYFLVTGYTIQTMDGGAFFGEYEETYCDRGGGTDPLDWGFPPTATWIPKELFEYDDIWSEDTDEENL